MAPSARTPTHRPPNTHTLPIIRRLEAEQGDAHREKAVVFPSISTHVKSAGDGAVESGERLRDRSKIRCAAASVTGRASVKWEGKKGSTDEVGLGFLI